jgi:hypothetical protein
VREAAIQRHPDITRGRQMPFVDTFGNVLAIPNKLLLLTVDFESHAVSPEIEAQIERFVDEHELYDVRVRINEYDPLGELWRLLANGRVNVFLRLLFGPLLWLGYVLNIGRLFGGDHYNAFSNTVNLYSNHPAIALHEMGHALDFSRRRFPGLYALLRFVPGVALYQEYLASLHAIEHFRAHGMHDEEIRAYRVLFPAYSTYVFGTLVDLFPSAVTRWAMFPCIAVGHLLGNYTAGERAQQIDAQRVTLAGQWNDEKDRALVMFSPATAEGRGQLGVIAGMFVGSAICGPGGPIGAYLGFLLARSTDR